MPRMTTPPSPPIRRVLGFRVRTWALLIALLVLGAGALALDLAFEGRVYDALWRLTGENDPGGQIVGFGQYLARWTRVQPRTEPYADVAHTDVNPFGVNTFLEQEVELSKREEQMRLISEAGFGWIRQQFPWEDIEIHGKGDFEDRRNDLDGDGQPDAISAWDKYDTIVDLAEQYGVQILARLSTPPDWAQSPEVTGDFAPPADLQDFIDYAVAVAERYQGRITHYQVWNEPNLYPEWGDQTVNAEAYTEMLCRTHDALKAIDPEIVVVTGALGPTIDLSGRNAYDLLYLQRMYQAGAGACFDVLSVQGYGLWSGPTDQRLRQTTINYPRHLWIRDMMVAHGDAHKPIWISEAGWNPVPDDPTIADWERYGRVTMDEAAAWAPQAYARAIEEWPWIGVINYWYFKRADDSERGASWYYFRMVEPDFTPTPIYESLKAYITAPEPKTLGAGRHSAQVHAAIEATNGGEARTFRIRGTGAALCYTALDAPQTVRVQIESEAASTFDLPANEAGCAPLVNGLDAGTHTLTITISDWSGLDDLLVLDFSARQRLPWLLVGVVALIGVAAIVVHAYAVRWGL